MIKRIKKMFNAFKVISKQEKEIEDLKAKNRILDLQITLSGKTHTLLNFNNEINIDANGKISTADFLLNGIDYVKRHKGDHHLMQSLYNTLKVACHLLSKERVEQTDFIYTFFGLVGFNKIEILEMELNYEKASHHNFYINLQ